MILEVVDNWSIFNFFTCVCNMCVVSLHFSTLNIKKFIWLIFNFIHYGWIVPHTHLEINVYCCTWFCDNAIVYFTKVKQGVNYSIYILIGPKMTWSAIHIFWDNHFVNKLSIYSHILKFLHSFFFLHHSKTNQIFSNSMDRCRFSCKYWNFMLCIFH